MGTKFQTVSESNFDNVIVDELMCLRDVYNHVSKENITPSSDQMISGLSLM